MLEKGQQRPFYSTARLDRKVWAIRSARHGSGSIPQDRVMRAIIYESPQTNTQHFYVAGSKFTGGEESLGVWLVYELRLVAEVEPGSPADQETNKSKWYRSLFLGEAGEAGRIVARYKNPIYPDEQLTHMEKCWSPGCSTCLVA